MDEERRTRIQAALARYRETVVAHNFELLHTLVEALETEPLPAKISPEVAQSLHVKEMRRHLQGAVPEAVQSPRDLLDGDLRIQLIECAALDGVSHEPVDLQRRADYFAAIRTRIAHLQVGISNFPPADLEYLCTLVDGVTGPGLPLYREIHQFDFISPLGNGPLNERVKAIVPSRPDDNDDNGGVAEGDELKYMWEEWDIAFAFKIGVGPRAWGGAWALYCRLDESEPLKWRYGLHDEEWYSDVYDSVEHFLEYHANNGTQEEADLRKAIRPLKAALK